jgi:hypothetical protein
MIPPQPPQIDRRYRAVAPSHTTALAVGAQAIGAVALGALAIGFLAIYRLKVRQSHFGRLEIDDLVVHRLRVDELTVMQEWSGSGHHGCD